MDTSRRLRRELFGATSEHWSLMTVYERFEQVIAFALSLTVAVVVVIAFYQLLRQVVPLVVGGPSIRSTIPCFRRCSAR